jgi:hypothetical protein
MAKINHISTISGNNEWYVVYDNSDSMTDYFNSTRGSQKYITEVVKNDGAEHINVTCQNGTTVSETNIKAIKRLAKRTGYKVQFKKMNCTNYSGDVWVKEWAELTKEVI